MSLSARYQHALSSIEDEFAESDPRLSRLFDEFSQRMAGKKMPTPERRPAGWRRVAGGPSRWLRRLIRPRHARPSWLPTMLVVSFLLIGTTVAALVVSHVGSHGACTTAMLTQPTCGLHTPLPR